MQEAPRTETGRSGLTYPGKSVVITGGSKGIGAGCARMFVEAGATVVICARGAKAGRMLAEQLDAQGPGTCEFVACDVCKTEDIQRLINHAVDRHGRLDCLINNAGWHPPHHPIDEFSVEDFQDLLTLNLVSMFAACKYALPHLRETRGSIINMSSLVGVMGQEHAVTYVATKGGINALTKALAVDEARHGVRVNAVCPAAVITPLYEEARDRADDPQAFVDFSSSWHWLGRCATVEEVATVCLFLATDGAGFITGAELPVSGGAELAYGRKAGVGGNK